jgi:hypothetical protein
MAGIMDVINKAVGSFAGGAPSPSPQSSSGLPGYYKALGIEDGDAAYDTEAEIIAIAKLVTTGQFCLLWSKTVPAQQQMAWGFGTPVLAANQGYLWFAIVDKTTEFDEGQIRLQQCDANKYRTIVVQELATTGLHTATNTTIATALTNDKNVAVALPEQVQYPKVGEDSKLEIWYKNLSGTLANIDAAGFKIPATIFPV